MRSDGRGWIMEGEGRDGMRLDKFLADAGVGTRKEVKELIKKKRVSVNDNIVTDPSTHIDQNDIVRLDGEIIVGLRNVYIELNKPSGYISSTTNDDGVSVLELIDHPFRKHLHIVGRLDKDVEGLLLITNDGNYTHKVTSPKKRIEKEYLVFSNENIELSKTKIKTVEDGLTFGDTTYAPAKVKQLELNMVSIVITEGRFHEIKNISKFLGINYSRILRIRIGQLILDVEKGKWRELNDAEILKVFQS